jgi:hypothetical protein
MQLGTFLVRPANTHVNRIANHKISISALDHPYRNRSFTHSAAVFGYKLCLGG